MHIIKNALVFSADLPDVATLAEAMESVRHRPITELQASSMGFVETEATPALVSTFDQGMAFTLRIDEKVMPAGPVKAAVQEAVDDATAEAGHELDKGRIEDIKEETIARLIATALTKTTMIRAFYWPADKFLIVATSSERNAQHLMRLMIQACESVKTTTIHVDGVRFGLTAHLRNHLEGKPKDFGKFQIGDSVTLKNEGERVVFDVHSLDHAQEGLLEAIRAGMAVEKLELQHGNMSFALNGKFRFSKVSFHDEELEGDQDMEVMHISEAWANRAFIEVSQFAAALRELCVIFSRQTDVEIDAPTSASEEPEVDNFSTDMLRSAIEALRGHETASITRLQRHLKIGYNRAAHLMEELERRGAVSAPDHDGVRQTTL